MKVYEEAESQPKAGLQLHSEKGKIKVQEEIDIYDDAEHEEAEQKIGNYNKQISDVERRLSDKKKQLKQTTIKSKRAKEDFEKESERIKSWKLREQSSIAKQQAKLDMREDRVDSTKKNVKENREAVRAQEKVLENDRLTLDINIRAFERELGKRRDKLLTAERAYEDICKRKTEAEGAFEEIKAAYVEKIDAAQTKLDHIVHERKKVEDQVVKRLKVVETVEGESASREGAVKAREHSIDKREKITDNRERAVKDGYLTLQSAIKEFEAKGVSVPSVE